MPDKLQPYVVEIKHGTQKHTDVLEFVMNRVTASRNRRDKRADKWADAENLFTAYVKETDADSRRRVRRDNGIPHYTTVTIPYSYATLMTAHTYWTSVFLSRDPILQVQGTSGEAQTAEQAVEAMLQYYLIAGRNAVPLYIWLLDQGKYGEGILGTCWDVKKAVVPELRMGPKTVAGVPIPFTQKKEWGAREVTQYEGIRTFNVRPADFIFDPTVTLQNFQEGEFAGHEAFVSMVRILDGAAQGRYYNVDKIEPRRVSQRTRSAQGNNSDLPEQDLPTGAHGDAARGVDLIEITIELVPRQLSLANREYLEKWSFTVANDDTIISAQPLGWWHNEYTYDVLEHEIEGYNVSKRGMMELLQPLNCTLDWLINTHFFNVRKTLNNEFIYDPSMLVSKDVEAPGPGKLIRLRPEAYGKDVRAAFYQLQTADVTQKHVQDAQVIIEMMQRLTGVNDTVMGMLGTSRRTATEVRSSSSFAVNRLKTQCEYYSSMGFGPMTSRIIKMAQQMFQGREARFFRIVGNQGVTAQAAERYLKVGPDEIAGQYDYLPVDGTLPIDRQAQAAVFGQTLEQMSKIPQIVQQYDFAKLFGYLAQLNGVRNLQQFRINVVPDATAMQQAQAGNVVPITQAAPNMVNNGAGIATGAQQ